MCSSASRRLLALQLMIPALSIALNSSSAAAPFFPNRGGASGAMMNGTHISSFDDMLDSMLGTEFAVTAGAGAGDVGKLAQEVLDQLSNSCLLKLIAGMNRLDRI